ncbi:MAG: ATP-binding protein [Bacteroidota bacterium]
MTAINLVPAVFNWSGGKDSTLALHYLLQQQKFEIRYLLTTVNDSFNRVAMHGVRESILLAQAQSLDFPLYQVRLPELPDMVTYESVMNHHLEILKQQGIVHAVFGDLFLEDLKKYREDYLATIGITAVFPLWKRNSLELIKEFIGLGYKTIVVCTQPGLEDFCGRIIDQSFLNDLPAHIDPSGENGEFHTFVFDGPIFKQPVLFTLGARIYRTFPPLNSNNLPTGYWYIDLIPQVIGI